MKLSELEKAILAKKTYKKRIEQYLDEINKLSGFETLDMIHLPRTQFAIVFLNGCNNIKDCISHCNNKIAKYKARIKNLDITINNLKNKHYDTQGDYQQD